MKSDHRTVHLQHYVYFTKIYVKGGLMRWNIFEYVRLQVLSQMGEHVHDAFQVF